MCMAEIDTFDEMTGTIEGSITFGVKELTSKAISKKLITRKEQRKINSITPEHDQASFFVEVFAQKIEDDATVMERFIDMLREVPIYDKLVKKLEDKLVEKRAAALPMPPVSTASLEAEFTQTSSTDKEPAEANGAAKEAPIAMEP